MGLIPVRVKYFFPGLVRLTISLLRLIPSGKFMGSLGTRYSTDIIFFLQATLSIAFLTRQATVLYIKKSFNNFELQINLLLQIFTLLCKRNTCYGYFRVNLHLFFVLVSYRFACVPQL